MTGTYQIDLDDLADELGPLPDPSTPAGEALAWWLERVRQRTYVGLKEELPHSCNLADCYDRLRWRDGPFVPISDRAT